MAKHDFCSNGERKDKSMEWIDNADSWICPFCRTEVWSPAAYNYHCPKCGFIADKDMKLISCGQRLMDGDD